MSNEQPSRPPKRSGSGASPMGSTLAIVIAIAAVVVGFLILKNIRKDDNNDATSATTTAVATTIDPSLATSIAPLPTGPTTTAVFTPTTQGAKVQVANSSHANGMAGQLSTALQGKGFTMGEPTNGATKEAVTKIQYLTGDTAAQAVAQSVAQLMGVASIDVIPTPPQLQDPSLLADNTVLVLLGDDKAGKTLDQMSQPDTGTTVAGETTTSAAP
ncbi:MAG TPA: LytR C-terminal domain-containing protein [Ilumatobacteraceae bacterium]|nr:LytR C-terminal domain-containing protein [Ilumatobacteraceae bacterium]